MSNKTAYMQYTIDGEPADVSRLIKAARWYRPDFIPENQPEGICRTSEATKILRHYGHGVGRSPDYAGEMDFTNTELGSDKPVYPSD